MFVLGLRVETVGTSIEWGVGWGGVSLLPTTKVIVVSSTARAVWIKPPSSLFPIHPSTPQLANSNPFNPVTGRSADWWSPSWRHGVAPGGWRAGVVVAGSSLLRVTFCKMIPVELTWLVTKETHRQHSKRTASDNIKTIRQQGNGETTGDDMPAHSSGNR